MCKGKLSIVRAAISLGVSVVLAAFACYACFAWFSSNNNVNSSGVSLFVKSTMIDSAKLTYYSYDSASKTYIINTKDEISMGKYSSLNSSKDYCTLVKATFTGDFDTLSLSAVSNAASYLGEYNNDTGALKTQLTAQDNSLSSVIRFYALSDDELKENDNGSYTVTTSSATTSATFVDNIGTANPKFSNKVDLFTDTAEKNLFILLDYNDTAMADIFGKNLGNNIVTDTDDNSIYFKCDFYLEAV